MLFHPGLLRECFLNPNHLSFVHGYFDRLSTSFTEHTEKDNSCKLFSVKISEIRGVRVPKRKLRNSLSPCTFVTLRCNISDYEYTK